MHMACCTLLMLLNMRDSKYWIGKLNLQPHPEGGYYKETYRSDDIILKEHLPEGFSGQRNISTAIYYLLENEQCSKLHRIRSDEMWHFYDGCGLVIFVIDKEGNYSENKLGLNTEEGELPQVLIKAGNWFGAKVSRKESFCLAGCTVSPGFHFDDFELADRKTLSENFPKHIEIIEVLT